MKKSVALVALLCTHLRNTTGTKFMKCWPDEDGKVVPDAVHVVAVAAADEENVFGLPQLGLAPLQVVGDVQKDDVLAPMLQNFLRP